MLIPWVVHAQTNQDATGRPVVLVSAEGAGILAADTWGICRRRTGSPMSTFDGRRERGSGVTATSPMVSYQWIRVDGGTETNIGTDSPRYQLVEADFGKLIKVQVSFTDQEDNFSESVTSLPFGPIARTAPLPSPGTLVGNTGQSPSATATITQDYAMRFRLGTHGQGYEISSVSIDLAAVAVQPDRLPVDRGPSRSSLQRGRVLRSCSTLRTRPPSQAGLNEFTAPAGVFAYQNLNHFDRAVGFRLVAVDQGDDVGR